MSRRPCRLDRIVCVSGLATRSPDSGRYRRTLAAPRDLAAAVAVVVASEDGRALWLASLLLFPVRGRGREKGKEWERERERVRIRYIRMAPFKHVPVLAAFSPTLCLAPPSQLGDPSPPVTSCFLPTLAIDVPIP